MNGDLNIYVRSTTSGFQEAKIYSNETKDITLTVDRIGGESVGSSMEIYASDAKGTLDVACLTDCQGSTIECPQNDKTDGTDCFIDCSDVSGNNKCQNMQIYTSYGTPRDVKYVVFYIFTCVVISI